MAKARRPSGKNRNIATKAATPSAKQRPEAVVTSATQVTAKFSGPLPSPEILRGYDLVVPGAGERIIQMAESEQAHRHSMEQLAITETGRERRRGQLYGLIVAFIALGVAGGALYLGHPDAAATIGGWTIAGLAGVFVVGRFADSK